MNQVTLQHCYQNHRPLLHFTSSRGWINDPNGLIFHNGYYHLFYQHYPDGVEHGPMHWGHARSRDFLAWEELPIALYPDENGTIFSGCIVYDKDNTSGFGRVDKAPLVAIFTQHLACDDTVLQTQSLAYSLDDGITFEKFANNPVLDLGMRDFRDPKVFWDMEEGYWIMLLSAGQSIRFFTSSNLREWTPLGSFAASLMPDEIWECPDLLQLTDDMGSPRWVLVVSQNTLDYSKTGVRYFVGTFRNSTFTAQQGADIPLYLDFGRDNYAVATYANIAGRVVQQGWMSCWAYASRLPAKDFRGSMTFPRELSLKETAAGLRLLQQPASELLHHLGIAIKLSGNQVTTIDGSPAYYRFTFAGSKGNITFKNANSLIVITLDFDFGKVTVDRSGCATNDYGPYFLEASATYFSPNCDRTVTVLLDVTSIELFVAGGEAVGTFQYFVTTPFDTIVTVDR